MKWYAVTFGILVISLLFGFQESFAEQATGKPAWETNSDKVCGDKLCPENDRLYTPRGFTILQNENSGNNRICSFTTCTEIHKSAIIYNGTKGIVVIPFDFPYGEIHSAEWNHNYYKISGEAFKDTTFKMYVPLQGIKFEIDAHQRYEIQDNFAVITRDEPKGEVSNWNQFLPLKKSFPHSGYDLDNFNAIGYDVLFSIKQQMKNGVHPKHVLCPEELTLILKHSNNSPACVTLETKEKLIERGWGLSYVTYELQKCMDAGGLFDPTIQDPPSCLMRECQKISCLMPNGKTSYIIE